jgi:hypothetical protein
VMSRSVRRPVGAGTFRRRFMAHWATALRKAHCSGDGSSLSPVRHVIAPMARCPSTRGTENQPDLDSSGAEGSTRSEGRADTQTGSAERTARAVAVGPSWSTISHARVRDDGSPVEDTRRSADMGPRR